MRKDKRYKDMVAHETMKIENDAVMQVATLEKMVASRIKALTSSKGTKKEINEQHEYLKSYLANQIRILPG